MSCWSIMSRRLKAYNQVVEDSSAESGATSNGVISISPDSSLFSAASKVGAILSDKDLKFKEALEFYGKNLGLTFQIADDTLDYNSELKLFGKKIGNDFFEGKVTLPIILLYQKVSELDKIKIKSLFDKEERKIDELDYVLELIKKKNIIRECHTKAEHFINLASNSLSVFENTEEKEILKNLTSFSVERNF